MLELWTSGEESPGDDYQQREPGVFVGRDVRIFPGAHVAAPALLGHGVVIGNNALVRGSIVGPRAVVGFGSEVARSYLAPKSSCTTTTSATACSTAPPPWATAPSPPTYRIDGRTVPSMVGAERLDSGA